MWDKVLGDWYQPLKSVSIDQQYLQGLKNFLDKRYAFYHVYPNKKDVFKAFQATPFKDTRVVIVNQTPYHNGKATGLAFANEEKTGVTISPSLKAIEECITFTVKDGLYFMDYSLEKWAKQGVLLLNASLTVEKGQPNSHMAYWDHFTEKVIKAINDNKTGVIFLFIGNTLGKYSKLIDHNRNHLLRYYHPARAIVKQRDWNCPHFNTINLIIERQNGTEYCIDW